VRKNLEKCVLVESTDVEPNLNPLL
jgi:hypothetical protein